MNRLILLLILILAIVAGVWGWDYYKKNLASLWTALVPASQNLPQVTPNPENKNTTGLPLVVSDGSLISIFAKDLAGPRVITADPEGNIIVSLTSGNKVVALPDKNKDGVADETITIVEGLNKPHGIAFLCHNQCSLYIAETNQVAVYDYDQTTLKASNKKKIIDLPDGGGHYTRTILVTPENKLLISSGSSCNVCNETDNRRAAIWIADSDGANFRPYAKGLRNSVFMAINPKTQEIWATEMGRDLLGDDIPPDEINIIKEDKDYGWPRCYGKQVRDVNFDSRAKSDVCSGTVGSHIDIQAHSAPLGLAFVKNGLLVAYHGSWNRSTPTGYKIVKYELDNSGNYTGKMGDYLTGFTSGNTASGRPVDIFSQSDNKIYVSDDKAGVVYLIR